MGPRAIGSEINGWEIKSRLIRSANWVFDAETRWKRRRRGRRFVSAATCNCSKSELGPKNGFQRTHDPISVCFRNRSSDTSRISFKQRLQPRNLEIIERCLETLGPVRRASIQVDGEVAGNFLGSEHRFERVSNGTASSVVSDCA